MAILRTILVGAAVVAALVTSDAARIDGGDEFGWDQNRWYVQVDGVMGGKSSGEMEFMSENNVMRFTGDIVTQGGGFSSVRRQVDLNLSEYTGVVVTLEAESRDLGKATSPPTGLHLQLGDRTSYYSFSSAFAIPLAQTGDGPVVTSVYLPMESFDRGSSSGFTCRGTCILNTSQIDNMSVYVLFQEGSFDVRLRSIEAVMEPRSFPLPAYDILESEDDVMELIRSTIASGGSLYDKSYVELCIAMYWSVLNTILSSESGAISDPVRAVICAGLQQVEAQMDDGDSKANIAWTLRYAMDAATADIGGFSRTTTQTWLPTVSEAVSMDALCLGRTSAAQGLMYDPSNEYILVSSSGSSDNTGDEDPPSNNSGSNGENDEEESPTENEAEPPANNALEEKESLTTIEEEEQESLVDNTGDVGEILGDSNTDESNSFGDSEIDETEPQIGTENAEEELQYINEEEEEEQEEQEQPLSEEQYEAQSNSTLAFDETLIEDPILKTAAAQLSDLSSGSTSFSGRGFESFVLGILLLGVVQLV